MSKILLCGVPSGSDVARSLLSSMSHPHDIVVVDNTEETLRNNTGGAKKNDRPAAVMDSDSTVVNTTALPSFRKSEKHFHKSEGPFYRNLKKYRKK